MLLLTCIRFYNEKDSKLFSLLSFFGGDGRDRSFASLASFAWLCQAFRIFMSASLCLSANRSAWTNSLRLLRSVASQPFRIFMSASLCLSANRSAWTVRFAPDIILCKIKKRQQTFSLLSFLWWRRSGSKLRFACFVRLLRNPFAFYVRLALPVGKPLGMDCSVRSRHYTLQNKQKTANFLVCCLFFGGDGRDRTDDLLNAIQALSQLSYAPISLQALILLRFWLVFYIQFKITFGVVYLFACAPKLKLRHKRKDIISQSK